MTNPRISLSGTYPRKEELVKSTWNFDKGLVSRKELDDAFLAAAKEVVSLQRANGLEPLTDGLLTWQDQFRPLVETSPAFEVGGVTRLFENNRFYRQPILNAAPKLDWAKLEPYFPHVRHGKGAWKAILPSPYWFTRAAKDNLYQDEFKLGHALAGYVNSVARRLDKLGYAAIQFQEPCLFSEAKPDVGFANELLAEAAEGLTCETIANFPNGDAAPHHSFLKTAPVTTVGIDFVETLPEKLPPRLAGLSLQAAVVNGQESHVESASDVRSLVERVEKKLKPSRLTCTHTWDLEFVPHEVALKKVAILGTLPARKVSA